MRYLIKTYLAIAILLMLIKTDGIGQCAFEGDVIIEDLSTTSIPIFVSDALTNDLSTEESCLEAVTIHFKHQFIGDLVMELVSPFGQKVTLVGPSETISASTSLVTGWDVQFFAESLLAVPDSGYEPIWNNLQTWLGFTTYVGKYYPHIGKLEDFDMGPVNGTWTLNIIDNVQFGTGHIYCLDLIFCEEVTTTSCKLVEHTLEEDAIQACQGDASLELNLEPDLEEEYDPTEYGYTYFLFEDDQFQSIVSDQDLSSYAAGNYMICGILYDLEVLASLNSITENESKSNVEAFILDNGICASFSNDCVEITILPFPEVITEPASICLGDTIVINGTSYTQSGLYEILTMTEQCDSMSILDLTVQDVDVIIEADLSTLSCDNPIIMLDGRMTDIPTGALIRWRTQDGNFVTSDLIDTVFINTPGTYTFRVNVEGCIFEQDIIIDETEDFVNVELSANVLTCTLDSTFIDLNVSDSIVNVSWFGPFPFSELNEDIRVGSGGVYTVNFTTNFGCEITQEIEIIEERAYPNITIIGDTLSCTQFEALLIASPADTLGSTFQWFSEDGNLSIDTFQVVNSIGNYSVEVITELGCIDTFAYEVITTEEPIEIELVSDSITCDEPSVTIGFISESEDFDVIWVLPDNEVAIEPSFSTSQVGTYNLSLVDSFGCTLDTFLVVGINNTFPDIEILNASFLCGDDSIQLVAQSSFDDLSYEWTRPDGIAVNEMSPFVSSPGIYFLEACGPNGCCAYDTINVGVDITVPFLEFEFENLDCNNDTTYIIPADTLLYEMEWSLNGIGFSSNSDIIEVTEPGFYEVVVIDSNNGCSSNFSFNIEIDIYNEIESLDAQALNCVNDEVQILITSVRNFESFSWDGPSVMDNNLEPFVNVSGEYILEYTFTNGCSGTDTIEVIQEGEFPNLQGENKTITCFDAFVTLSAEYSSSSISLTWSGPNVNNVTADSIQVTNPGTYMVTGIAPGSCKDTLMLEVFGDTIAPIISIFEDGEITCTDSIILISAAIDANTEFYEVSGPGVINSSDLIFEVETAGIYIIEAVGFNGCTSVDSAEVIQSNDFPDYIIDLDSLNCNVGSVTVGFTSNDLNLSVNWDGPMNVGDDEYSFTTSQAGNYVFSVTNENGCFLMDSFFVLMDTFPPNSEIALSSHINCLNDSVTVSITNPNDQYEVNWTGPGVIDPSVSEFVTGEIGAYSVSIVSLNGCITEDFIALEYDTLSPEILVLGDPINCSAGKTFLKVESDLPIDSYDWTGPDGFISTEVEPLVFEEGVYDVTVIAPNGCISSGSINVEDERVFPEIAVDDFYLPCDGSEKEIFTSFITEGSFVRWYGPNDYFSPLDTALVIVPGEHIAIAFNEEGCTASDTFQVIDLPILPEFSGFSELLLCLGPIALTAEDVDDDGAFYWNGPNGFYSEDNPAMTEEPGIYQLVVTTTNGCTDSMAVEVIDGRIYPEAVASINEPFQCNNLEVNLSGEGSSTGNIYTYQWTTLGGNILEGETTLKPNIDKEGTYILEVTNNNIGCTSYDTLIILIEEQGLMGAEIELIEPTCLNFGNAEINLTEIIGGFSPYNIFVDDFDYGERTNIQYLTSGEHLITIVDSLGCQHDTLIMIPDNGVLQVELPMDTTICFGDSFFIQPIINLSADSISSIVWSSNVPCAGCEEISLFMNEDMDISIQVTDINGCVVNKEFTITVDRPNNLPFPQIFSPNGDNINDVFYMPMTKSLTNINYIKIYDNWGGLLFFEENLAPGDDSKGWRGTVNGQNAEIAVYIVEALVTLVDGSQVVYVGDLTLLR